MKKFNQSYEAPTAEFIEIEAQCVLCASTGPAPTPSPTNPTGNGLQFDTQDGEW